MEASETVFKQIEFAPFGSQHQYSMRFNRVSVWEATEALSKQLENERSGIQH